MDLFGQPASFSAFCWAADKVPDKAHPLRCVPSVTRANGKRLTRPNGRRLARDGLTLPGRDA